MLGLNKLFRKQRLNFEQLKILQMVTQQVVLSIEGTVRLPGAGKKVMAIDLVGRILKEMDLVAPNTLVDTLIESAVSILKALDKAKEKTEIPRFSLDISGHPKLGDG